MSPQQAPVVSPEADTPADIADAGRGIAMNPVQPDADEGFFDVYIPAYRDRVLPDVRVPVEAGVIDWPNCPSDLGVGPDGNLTQDLTIAYPVFAAQYDESGQVVPAPEGSECATHAWTGLKEWDACFRLNDENDNRYSLPLCHTLVDAGNAVQGSGANRPLFALCQELTQCVVKTGCGFPDPVGCLCGPNLLAMDCEKAGALGPCAAEELAALQINPGDADAIHKALQDYTATTTPSNTLAAAGPVNYVFYSLRIFDWCNALPPDGGLR